MLTLAGHQLWVAARWLALHTEDLADGSHIYEAAPITSKPTTRRDAHKGSLLT